MILSLGTSIQKAIDICASTGQFVEMSCFDSNEEIRLAISDLKGCEVMKSNPESTEINIFPPVLEENKDHFHQV